MNPVSNHSAQSVINNNFIIPNLDLASLKADGLRLESMPEHQKDPVFVEQATIQNPEAFQFSSDELKNNKEFIASLLENPNVNASFFRHANENIFSVSEVGYLLSIRPELINVIYTQNRPLFWQCLVINPLRLNDVKGSIELKHFIQAAVEVKSNRALIISLLATNKIDIKFLDEALKYHHDIYMLHDLVTINPASLMRIYHHDKTVFLELIEQDIELIEFIDTDALDWEWCEPIAAFLFQQDAFFENIQMIASKPKLFATILEYILHQDDWLETIALVNDEHKTKKFYDLIIHGCPSLFEHCPDFVRGSKKSLDIAFDGWSDREAGIAPSPFFFATEELKNNFQVCLRQFSLAPNPQVDRVLWTEIPDAVKRSQDFIFGFIRYRFQVAKTLMETYCPKFEFDFYVKAFLEYHENSELIKRFPQKYLTDDKFWIEVLKQKPSMLNTVSFPSDLKFDWNFLRDRVIPIVPNIIKAFPPELRVMARLFSHPKFYPSRVDRHQSIYLVFKKMLNESYFKDRVPHWCSSLDLLRYQILTEKFLANLY